MNWLVLVAAGIGSFTAFLIAFVGYPWQKNKDRVLQINLEQRNLYLDILKKIVAVQRGLEEFSAKNVESLDALLQDWLKSIRDLNDSLLVLSACGDREVVEAATECSETLRKGLLLLGDQLTEKLDSSAEGIDAKEFKTVFRDTRKKISKEADPKGSILVNLLRKNVFLLDGKIHIQGRITDSN